MLFLRGSSIISAFCCSCSDGDLSKLLVALLSLRFSAQGLPLEAFGKEEDQSEELVILWSILVCALWRSASLGFEACFSGREPHHFGHSLLLY